MGSALDVQARSGQISDKSVDITAVPDPGVLRQSQAGFRERRSLTCVEARLELAVGALEVVFVEINQAGEAAIVAEFDDVQVCRFISGLVRPSAETQRKSLPAYGQCAHLFLVELANESFGGSAQRISTADQVGV